MNDEHPILMNGEMVRAILEGRKTQTRRPVKLCHVDRRLSDYGIHAAEMFATMESAHFDADYNGGQHFLAGPLVPCASDQPCCDGYRHKVCMISPFGKPGDRLWVRETWREVGSAMMADGTIPQDRCECRYRADDLDDGPWRPSIHMPRWACRLVLRVERVRVERVQDISEEDAEAEGVDVTPYSDMYASEVFSGLWNEIYPGGFNWGCNPWVWVCGFSVAGRKEPER